MIISFEDVCAQLDKAEQRIKELETENAAQAATIAKARLLADRLQYMIQENIKRVEEAQKMVAGL